MDMKTDSNRPTDMSDNEASTAEQDREGDGPMRQEYDTYILNELSDVIEDRDAEFTLRDLTSGIYKYKEIFVNAMVSKDPDKYPDLLWIRLGKGQLQPGPWSINIRERLDIKI